MCTCSSPNSLYMYVYVMVLMLSARVYTRYVYVRMCWQGFNSLCTHVQCSSGCYCCDMQQCTCTCALYMYMYIVCVGIAQGPKTFIAMWVYYYHPGSEGSVCTINTRLHFCTARNQLISDEAYSFGDQFLNAERDERVYLVNKETAAVSESCTCINIM